LLAEFYIRVLIPPAVASELERDRAIGIDLPEIGAFPWMKIQAPEGLDKVPMAADLGAGEKQVLALGLQVSDAVVILDERLARLHAEALKLTFTGTRNPAARKIGKPNCPNYARARTTRPLAIPLVGENSLGSSQAGWRRDLQVTTRYAFAWYRAPLYDSLPNLSGGNAGKHTRSVWRSC
jgi:hypothetical protein